MALITVSAILSCKEWWERKEIDDEGARGLTEEDLKGLSPVAAACLGTWQGG